MAEEKKRDAEVITLGSGDLMIKEFVAGSPIAHTDFNPKTDLLGRISGGATLSYKPTFYEAKDDKGLVSKTKLTAEEATLKSGVITWNGNTLKKLVSTAEVVEDKKTGIRTVKLGGINRYDGKSYALCFHYEDEEGDTWTIIRGVNQSGIEIAYAKDKETVIDAEFKCLPMDDQGTLIMYVEEMTKNAV